jgi:PemK-like, MazF-like toxin of type II toxin-antitoxin system
MQRGEIWQVAFNHARGGEANKVRPAVIVGNDRANATAAPMSPRSIRFRCCWQRPRPDWPPIPKRTLSKSDLLPLNGFGGGWAASRRSNSLSSTMRCGSTSNCERHPVLLGLTVIRWAMAAFAMHQYLARVACWV